MSKYIKINEDLNIKFNKGLKTYLNPDYVFIPYHDGVKLNIKNNEIVQKNSILYIDNGRFIYSPISGKISGINDNIVDGKQEKTIAIENDFRENSKPSIKKDYKKLTREQTIQKIRKYSNITEKFNKPILIINGSDYEPYEQTTSYLIKEHIEEILETVDFLINKLKIEECYFVIRNDDDKNVETLINQIGMYPNIELRFIPNEYPIAHRHLLIKEITSNYKETSYLTAEEVYLIYNILKKDRYITEKFITISGNLINKSAVINVKLGSRITDIIYNNFKIIDNNYHIIINGLLSGYEINNMNAIITPNIRSIFICKSINNIEGKCINCGLCHIKCPMGCDPRTNYMMNKCIKCGLCNYICPSRIQLVGKK